MAIRAISQVIEPWKATSKLLPAFALSEAVSSDRRTPGFRGLDRASTATVGEAQVGYSRLPERGLKVIGKRVR